MKFKIEISFSKIVALIILGMSFYFDVWVVKEFEALAFGIPSALTIVTGKQLVSHYSTGDKKTPSQ